MPIQENLPFNEYRQWPGINQSSFSAIDPDRGGCPAIYKAKADGELEEEAETEAKTFGRAFHAYCLERDTFAADYVVETPALYEALLEEARDSIAAAKADVEARREAGEKVKDLPKELVATSRRKRPDKFSKQMAEWKDWQAKIAAEGKEALSASSANMLDRMHRSILSNKVMAPVMTNKATRFELSASGNLFDHGGNPILCKGRFDILTEGNQLIDLKTVQDASPRSCGRFITGYKSYVQAAFYIDLAKACDLPVTGFSWAFVDKRAPHPTVYYTADESMIHLGRQEYRSWLGWIFDGRESGKWPGHSDMIELPGWFTSMLEEVA